MGNCLVIGNCCGINCNFNISCDRSLFLQCSPDERPARKTLDDLLFHRARLKAARDAISRKIEESPEMRQLDIVNQWIGQVTTVEDQVEKIITDWAQSDNNCLINKKSHSLWENIASVDQQVLDLLSQVPDDVFQRPQLVPTESTIGVQSMFDEVWSHVENQQDDHVGLIGLYGMGGVGKTALLKAVNNKLCSSTLNFDLQLWIDVSKFPNPVNIQNQIGEKIGFNGYEWKIKSLNEKAEDINNVLCQHKYILLLDDIWEQFDLVKIGIPFPNLTNKSKIILTTRSLHVCRQMKAMEIQIRSLNDEEAWNLFKKSVGEKTLNAHRDIDGLARVVMRECSGLPLALIVIGRAMTLKTTVHDWEHAINVLQGYTAEFSTITDQVYTPLRHSYDNLTNDALRSCFLYCSSYAKDEEILKIDLVNKWISEGFLGRFGDLSKDQDEGYSYITTLLHASLLEECSLEGKVKMHPVIRDMALWIGRNGFYVKARALPQQVQTDPTFGTKSMLGEVWGHVEELPLMDPSFEEVKKFDNLWVPFTLKEATNKSKVKKFPTGSLDVCGQMRARPIKVQCLEEEEAWNLFKENVGERTLNAHHDIPDRARLLMRECNGLPLALVVIARAMSLKTTIHEWEHAIQELKRYTSELSSTVRDKVFIPLKYSYDNLTNDAIRSCLLYCSLYAEDQEILKSDLVDKWIFEGFLGRFHDLDKDRNEGYSYISTLVRASLLVECSFGPKVKMHDEIRDMALWIVGDGFYVKARAGLTEVPKDVKWGHVEKLSLMDNSIVELNNGPIEVTYLKTVLFSSLKLRSINNDFWKSFSNLKVLDLSYNMSLWSLPKEFCDLVCLQYLNLDFTGLKKLPNEFQKLEKLKYLNVGHTNIQTIPEGVLSSMKELSVFICGETITKDLNLVKEFEGLKNLRDVQIEAASKIEISNLTSSINLLNCITRFIISSISESTSSFDKGNQIFSSFDILFLKEMKHLQVLTIQKLKRVEKIVVGEWQDFETSTRNNRNGFNSLRSLHVYGCSRLKNLSWLVFFPNIETIKVSDCGEMRTLVSENEYKLDNEVEPFAKLQTLELSWMPKLESIYFTTLSFPCLKRLSVWICFNLKRLPFNSSSCDQGRGITIVGQLHWKELQWEDEATRTTFSSRFKFSG